MDSIPERYHRSMLLFGADGQRALGRVAVAIVGAGGVGSALAHVALLGVHRITSIDPEELDETNRNRFIGARITDPVPGTLKVALIDRLIRETNSDVESIPIAKSLLSLQAFDAIRGPTGSLDALTMTGREPSSTKCAQHTVSRTSTWPPTFPLTASMVGVFVWLSTATVASIVWGCSISGTCGATSNPKNSVIEKTRYTASIDRP